MYVGKVLIMEINGDKLRGHLDGLILSVLAQGEAHGFDIIKQMEARGSGVLKLREGSLYPALYRLEGRGLIAGRWEDDEGRPRGARRRLYTLTEAGRGSLAEQRAAWRQFSAVVGAILEA